MKRLFLGQEGHFNVLKLFSELREYTDGLDITLEGEVYCTCKASDELRIRSILDHHDKAPEPEEPPHPTEEEMLFLAMAEMAELQEMRQIEIQTALAEVTEMVAGMMIDDGGEA